MPYTRGQIREEISQRCDIENATHSTIAEINRHINNASAYVHDFLIQTFQNRYSQKGGSITTVAGQNTYALPVDFYRPIAIGLETDDIIIPLNAIELAYGPVSTVQQSWGIGFLPRYLIQTDNENVWTISFSPPPDAIKTISLQYHHTPAVYDDDADTIDYPQNAVDLLVLEVVTRIKDKEERDTSRYERERAMIQERIQAWASPVDTLNPSSTIDMGGRRGWGSIWRNRIF